MQYRMPYGDEYLTLDLPGNGAGQVLESRPLSHARAEEEMVREALARPIGSPPLSRLVRKGEKVCIITGDMTRLWVRHHLLLPAVLDELNRGGVGDEDIYIVSATGHHRRQTAAEHRLLVGPDVYSRVPVYDHRARDKEALVYLGDTGLGTPVWLNKKVVEADRVVLTGGIVYHFLAGWGGGKKAVLPGVAGYETIMKNHGLAFNRGGRPGLNPAVRAGHMEGNPCSEDMSRGAGLLGPCFLVNCVVDDRQGRIARVFAGDYLEAHREGCRFVEKHFGAKIDKQVDLVIASCGGYPKDIDFYQSYKAIYNAAIALQKGGTLLLLSECREGMGNKAFERMLFYFNDSSEREAELRRCYTIGGHQAYHAALMAQEYDILVYSSLPAEAVAAAGMKPVQTLQEAFSLIRRKHGEEPRYYIMPHAATVLPRL